MDPERHRRLSDLFGKACVLGPSDRREFLDRECHSDRELRAEVESLLDHDRDASRVLPSAAPLVGADSLLADNVSWKAPDQIGRYRILRELGKGGMGIVYLAEQEEPLQRRVALKLIKWGMDTESVIARFESERQVLALMDHPNIARVYDAGATQEGRPYFVMEYVEGTPIDQYCDTHGLSVRSRLELFLQVCAGVQHAHQKGIIHRDIKPSNVLAISQDAKPVLKIIDFGIAKATAQSQTEHTLFTKVGHLVGTPGFMSPEQADPTCLDIDTRTDVYALGVLLYRLLVGALPFDFDKLENLEELRRMIREDDPPAPSRRLGGLGDAAGTIANSRGVEPRALASCLRGDLDWIVGKAIEKERARRYPSPSELAADIARHLRNEPVVAGPPSNLYRFRKFMRRHRIGVAVAILLMSTLLVGAAGTTIGLIRATRAERVATAAKLRANDEADRANSQARTAEQVSNLLIDLFYVSDPSEARGNTITAREILDRGATTIQQDLRDQPLVQARLMDTIGRVYRNLGLFERARPLLEGALQTREAFPGADDRDVAANLDSLGSLHKEMGEYRLARSLYERALAIRQRILSPDDPAVASSLNNLAVVLYDAGGLQEARRLHENALLIREKVLPPDALDLAASRMNLGIVLSDSGEVAKALVLLEQARNVYELRIPDGPDLGIVLETLGALRALGGEFDAALQLFRRTLAIREKVLGANHPDVASALSNLGNVLVETKQYAEARFCFERAIRIWENAKVPNHPNAATARNNLAALLIATGQFGEARREHLRALEILKKEYGNDHPNVAEALEEYAGWLQKAGRRKEAEKAALDARSIRQRQQVKETARKEVESAGR